MSKVEINNMIIIDYNDEDYQKQLENSLYYRSYDKLVSTVADLKDIWDYLNFFNNTGIYVVREKRFVQEESIVNGTKAYDFTVEYSMFGTRVSSNNSDAFPEDTGAWIAGLTQPWDQKVDFMITDNKIYSLDDYRNSLKDFYHPNYNDAF